MGLVVGEKMKALLFSTPSNDNNTTVSNRHVRGQSSSRIFLW